VDKEILMTPEQRWQMVLAMQRMDAERNASRRELAKLSDLAAVWAAVTLTSGLGAAVMLAATLWAN